LRENRISDWRSADTRTAPRPERVARRRRRKIEATVKAKIAVEALRGQATVGELAALYEVHPNQIYFWRKQLIEQAARIFEPDELTLAARDREIEALHAKIGQLIAKRGTRTRRPRR